MILLVDIGNSSIKWSVMEHDRIGVGGSFAWSLPAMNENLDAHWLPLGVPERVICANVTGSKLEESVRSWCVRNWDKPLEFLGSSANACGVKNAYMVPERLGVDRWMALIAVHKEKGGPACIVDCGTAITIDVLDRGGKHLGGLILPGLSLMRTALLEHTSIKIDKSEEGNISLLARDTGDAINGGTLYSVIATLDRVMQDVETELGKRMRRIITGGDAERLLPLLQGKYQHEPDLVLRGMAEVVREESRADQQQEPVA